MEEELILPDEAPAPGEDGAGPAAKPVGLYQREDGEIVRQLQAWLREASSGHRDRRKEREAEWDAYSGNQWDDGDKSAMDKQGRARLTKNLLITLLAAVEGEERTNRQEIKFYGEGTEDDPAAEGMNRLLKWIMDQCGGEFSLSQMFKSQAAVGEGWVVPEVDFYDDPEGMIKLSFVDEDEMLDDPLSTDPVGRDSRFRFRVRRWTEDEIEARWKGATEKLGAYREGVAAATNETDGKGFPDIYLTPGDTTGPKLYCGKDKMWLVAEAWWVQIEPGAVVVGDDGKLEELTTAEFEERKAQREQEQHTFLQDALAGRIQPPPVDPAAMPGLPQPAMPDWQSMMPKPLQAKERPIRRLYQAFFCADQLLDKRPNPIAKLRRFPHIPARGIFDKKNREWFGLIKPGLDIQRQHNVEESAIIQLIQQMPKMSWMAPKGAYHNKAEWEQKIAQPGKMLEYNAQRGKPERIESPAIPRHLVELAMARPAQLREVIGVNIELTGQRQGGDPGVVMEMRKKAATTVLAPLFDNFRQAKLELGRVLLAYIQTYVSVGRRIRVLGDDAAEYVPMTQEMALGDFDLKVEETNASINDRITALTVLQTTLPQWIKAGTPVPPEVVDLLPIQPKVRDAMKRQLAWQLATSGQLPPPDWQPGMPVPPAAPPPGAGLPAPQPPA